MPKYNRAANDSEASRIFTNIYVKNFQDSFDETKLKDLFSKYGEITSVKIPLDNTGKPTGFGYVNFKNPEDAAKVIFILNKLEIGCCAKYTNT